MPTQAPTGSTEESREITAILAREPGVARDRLDLDDAVVNLRHFLREQLRHELRMGAGEENLRAARLAAHVINVSADAIAVAERLARQHFVAAHDRLAAAEIDDDVAVFDALHGAVHDLADTILVVAVLPIALGFAHLLHDDLLCRLRGDAAVFQRRQGLGDIVADLRRGIALLRILDADVDRVVLDRIGDEKETRQAKLAGLRVDLGAHFGLAAVARARGFLDRVFHRGDHDALVDGFLAGDRFGDLQQLEAVCTDGHVSLLKVRYARGCRPRLFRVVSRASSSS